MVGFPKKIPPQDSAFEESRYKQMGATHSIGLRQQLLPIGNGSV